MKLTIYFQTASLLFFIVAVVVYLINSNKLRNVTFGGYAMILLGLSELFGLIAFVGIHFESGVFWVIYLILGALQWPFMANCYKSLR